MRRSGLVLVVVASVLAARVVAQEVPKVPRVDWGTFNFKREIGSTTGVVAAPADSVYAVLPAMFSELGLSPKVLDPGNRVLELKRHRLVRKLGRLPLSRFLSCGDGLLGPNADSYHVYVTMMIQITESTKTKSNMTLLFGADAVDVPGGQSDRLPCSTTGLLEHQLVTKLQARFPAG